MNDNNKQPPYQQHQQHQPINIDNNLLKIIKSEQFSFESISKITKSLPQQQQHQQTNNNTANLNHNINKLETSNVINVQQQQQQQQNGGGGGGNVDDLLKIAEKAEKLLREILDSKQKGSNNQQIQQTPPPITTQTTIQQPLIPSSLSINGHLTNNSSSLNITQQPTALNLSQILTNNVNNYQPPSQIQQQQQPHYYQYRPPALAPTTTYPHVQHQQQQPQFVSSPVLTQMSAQYYATHPPPPLTPVNFQQAATSVTPTHAYYPGSYVHTHPAYAAAVYPTPPYTPSPYQHLQPQRSPYPIISQQQQQQPHFNNGAGAYQLQQSLKRKHFESRYRSYSNDSLNSSIASSCTSSTTLTTNLSTTSLTTQSSISNNITNGFGSMGVSGVGGSGRGGDDGEDDDINIARERELKELKCKSVNEKMLVFVKYYQQFKQIYIQRIQMLQCSDQLKQQFQQLIKYLNEYESILRELNSMISEHEHLHVCKNNHRKTKKFFNKTKTFIRYDCQKRLQTNIFEYRRQINSQDRFAGMYDIIDMNNYLISLLPDIGVSIRRYINKCEKARQQEQEDEDDANAFAGFFNSGDEDSVDGTGDGIVGDVDESSQNDKDKENNASDNDEESTTVATAGTGEGHVASNTKELRSYESFSKGIDALNRYLLKRVENEESIDELVKERIIKWINKRQAKYILIFSEVDKLLNQHKDGECYSKFHSYLLFNLGKLVTVCDSYHQKLKELLYSTTIRRKKKRKKVKLLPESMSDVFNEIFDLKRSLEHTKLIIKKCNEFKNY